MRTIIRLSVISMMVMVLFITPAMADTAAQIDKDVNAALQKLYTQTPAAKDLSKVAKGILVFPSIIKGA